MITQIAFASRPFGLVASLVALAATLPTPAASQSASRLDRSFDRAFQDAKTTAPKADEPREGDVETTATPWGKIYAGAAAYGGYDSNINLSPSGSKGGKFGGIDLGVGAIVSGSGRETVFAVRGSAEQHETTYRPERWDAGAFVDHRIAIANGMNLTVGGFYFRDEIEVDRSQRIAGYAMLDRDTETTSSFLRLRALDRNYLNAAGSTLPASILGNVTSAFSNTRTELAGGVLFLKDKRIAPFIQGGGALVDFNGQALPGDRNRTSREAFAIAGVRVTLDKSLHADIGARFNTREIADRLLAHHDSAFVDAKLVWSPSKKFYSELSVERVNQDPIAKDALFSEVTAIRFSMNGKPVDRVRGTLEAGLERLDQIGAGFSYDERYVGGRISYDVMPRGEVFAYGKASNTTSSRDSKETTDSYRVGVGFKVHN